MNITNLIKKAALVTSFGLVGLLGSDSAQAAGITSNGAQNFNITATVTANCTLTVANFAFAGSYSFAAGNQLSQNFNVDCSAGAPYDVVFDGGLNDPGFSAAPTRGMSNGADTLLYNLTLGVGGPSLSGDVNAATISAVGTGAVGGVDYSIVADIPAGQAVSAGAYSDTVAAVIWY